ncbi:hypothetical protein HYT25_03205 [Candidatus Pacearchaeota archaeon]|nr:hypothetical protein [Candidatus Pacearchaeota archaeon]
MDLEKNLLEIATYGIPITYVIILGLRILPQTYKGLRTLIHNNYSSDISTQTQQKWQEIEQRNKKKYSGIFEPRA